MQLEAFWGSQTNSCASNQSDRNYNLIQQYRFCIGNNITAKSDGTNSTPFRTLTSICQNIALNNFTNAELALLAAIISCLGLIGLVIISRHRSLQHSSKDPKTWPIIGSQLEATKNYDRLLDWITDYLSNEHRTVKMTFLGRRSYLTADPANVEHILKTNFHNYSKGPESHERLFDFLGNGILNTDGSTWRMHRKLGSMEFSVKKLKNLSSTVYKKHAVKLLEVVAKAEQGADMQGLLLAMTFDSICEVVLGVKNVRSLDTPSDGAEKLDGQCSASCIADALDNAQEMITRRYVFPWWRIQRLLNLGSERILREEITRFNAFLTSIIEDRMRQMIMCRTAAPSMAESDDDKLDNNGGADDLLSRFIKHELTLMSKTDRPAMLKDIREAMLSFVMAGRDTTASTLCWFLYCMCMNPDKQELAFQEVSGLDQRSTSNSRDYVEFAEQVLSYEALQSSATPYLHAALAETLRLYPAVPRDGKITLKEDVLPDGTYLKAGDQVAYIPYAMGRMPFIWGPDACHFRPERWLQNGAFHPQSPIKLTAFQAGPRMCLGKDAAYLQMKMTAAMLLRFFRFELMPDHQVQYRMMMVMTMKHGLRMRVTPR